MSSGNKTAQWKVAGSGLMSGIVGLSVPYPFNVVRCLQQTQPETSPSVVKAMRHVARSQGVRGLYRGIGTALCLYGPATSLFYLSYINSHDALMRWTGNEATSSFFAGMTANVFGTLLWTPMDNIIQRSWVSQKRPVTVIRDIYNRAGLGGFWRAYFATLGVWTPLCGVFFMAYEEILKLLGGFKFFEDNEHVGVFGASAAAASFAVLCTNPIDVCRTRYQIGTTVDWLSVAKKAIHSEGWKLLTIGLRARLLAIVPDMTVGISVFEVRTTRLSRF